ncbi:MAG TPA: CoB--CoM heterodisulfide reductase iron-sulfur subunit A family protein [Thermodesulfobacteriota bacterium]|nr:CoB--CoM heterodisulfide reductase iron-sulfur subunit A family protein [Thermodesulfobacteriota bacterium]
MPKRIGVFICHCGANIATSVDVEKVVKEISTYPGVAHAENYIYMCSDPGQDLIRKAIVEKRLDAVVNCNCSPSLHEKTFRNLVTSMGLNPYHCEIANIREHCSWPHIHDREMATKKAVSIIEMIVEKVRRNLALTPMVVPITKRALVVGGGIAGMQAATDIAKGGYEVILVERSPALGGHARQLSGTFPSMELVQCMINPQVTEVMNHPKITLYTSAEVEEVGGYVGNFKVKIKKEGTFIEEEVGTIVVATGYDLYPKEKITEYESDPDVIDGLQFERILSPSGPTRGEIRRPSDGKVPKEIVFIQCVGSRDPENHLPYCSRVCCMYTAKQAALYKKKVPDGQVYISYMDIRSDAKGCEEFIQELTEKERIIYLRGRVSRVFKEGDKIRVYGVDTLSGKMIDMKADLVVLATAMVASSGAKDLSRKLNIISDEYGFMSEAHIKLRPVETLTAGIYLAGTAQAPRDITDTISSASGAASKVLSLFSRKELLHEPEIAHVDEEVCSGCGLCVSICAYKAPELDPKKRVARVNEALCEGCGACASLCPSGAMQHKNFSNRQFFEMIEVAAGDYVELEKKEELS